MTPNVHGIVVPERRLNPNPDQRAGRVKAMCTAAMVLAAAITTAVHADNPVPNARPARAAETPPWEFSITAYPTSVRGDENYTSFIAIADRGALHFEARVNYESIGARSAFVGWTFDGGEDVTWSLTPLLGGAWGTTKAFVPGLEATVAWRALDVYVEAEYVYTGEGADRYLYAWSELGFRPVEWLRIGVSSQRTRIYGGDRGFEVGPFGQVTFGPVTVGAFWFNPGSSDQVVVGTIGASF